MPKPPNPELVRRILDLTLEELAEKPPEAINMRSLAAKAGVSPTAIYYHFSSKEALFERIKFEAMDELNLAIEAAIQAADRAAGGEAGAAIRLGALCRAFVSWCGERPHAANLLMEALPPRLELDEEAMGKYYSSYFRARDLIAAAAEEGSMAGDRDADLDASVGQAALWGIASLYRAKRIHPRFWNDIGPLVERFIELFVGSKGA